MELRDIDYLAIVLQTPRCLPPLLIGEPGTAKTSKVGALTRALDLHLETVIAAIREPSDFAGLPIPENGHGVRLEPPSWAVRLSKIGSGVCFFDEADKCPPAVQSALLRPILEGTVGDLQLPAGVKFIAAANPPEGANGGWELSAPLANRFVHLKWASPTAEEWRDWLFNGDAKANTFPKLNLEDWDGHFSQAKALAAGFLRARPGNMSESASKYTGRSPLAFATCRTWEAATRLLASCRSLGHQEAAMTLVEACIGTPVATEFLSWVRDNDLPDPETLLLDPKKWTPDPMYPDRAFAVCLAIGSAAIAKTIGGKDVSKKDRRDRWHQAWRVLNRAIALGKDLVTIPGNMLCKRENRPEGGTLDSDVRKIIVQLEAVVDAAGL